MANPESIQYRDLGWANSWGGLYTEETPQEVKDCLAAKHKTKDVDVGPRNRGMDHVVTCDICKIKYHYDSSD